MERLEIHRKIQAYQETLLQMVRNRCWQQETKRSLELWSLQESIKTKSS